jgi:hypothetical protein
MEMTMRLFAMATGAMAAAGQADHTRRTREAYDLASALRPGGWTVI